MRIHLPIQRSARVRRWINSWATVIPIPPVLSMTERIHPRRTIGWAWEWFQVVPR